MKKSLILFLIVNIFYACKNDKTAIKPIPTSEEKEGSIEQTKVLTLGTFHFKFPNLDVVKIDDDDQIDVLDSTYQKEIELIVDKLAKFKPTILVIERQPEKQQTYDSLYAAYLNGEHKLTRSEEQQIGFRLAKRLGLNRLYCADAWGTDYEDVKKVVYENDTIAKGKFMDYFYNNPDSILSPYRNEKKLFKTEGILAELKRLNSAEYVKKGLGSYLIGIFKYETKENNQFGPDFVTSWWFNRNLRIFRNIQRINAKPEDRILVIYGAGHMNLLNIFFEASPEYKLLLVNDYLN
ncbi:DUF5694 domain-containing protein [Flavobacteriaceae bacterium LMO-SS05]